MKNFAAIFPGQGSQSVGMFADFMDNEAVARTYAEANEALGYDIKNVTLNGPETELNKTEITQPALLTASVAAFRALEEKGFHPSAVAGHSLGEFSALVAAGCMDFKDAVKLVRLRGQAMQSAVPQGTGLMAAVLGLDDNVIIDTCAKVSTDSSKVWAANFNTPGQVVISGHKAAVEKASEEFAALGARKVVPLTVSVPSHCPLMQPACDKLAEALKEITFNDAKVPVYSNAYAKPFTKKDDLIDALIKQLTMPVLWVNTIEALKSSECIVEFGPGKVLSGLSRRIDKTINSANVNNPDSLEKTLGELA